MWLLIVVIELTYRVSAVSEASAFPAAESRSTRLVTEMAVGLLLEPGCVLCEG